jgi:hypothetical protein
VILLSEPARLSHHVSPRAPQGAQAVALACTTCHIKKRKCDGMIPCEPCRYRGVGAVRGARDGLALYLSPEVTRCS